MTTTDSARYLNFENTLIDILDKHTPTSEKTLRANHKEYVFKGMRQAIMRRSELEKGVNTTKNWISRT